MARVKRGELSEEDMPAAVRAQRQRAAVSELLGALAHQAEKYGAEIIKVPGPSTMLCHACGELSTQRNRAQLVWECDKCHTTWDQDINAATNIVTYVVSPASAPVLREAKARKDKRLGVLEKA